MENEIFEEVYSDDLNQSVDGVELVDSVEEVESSDTYTQDELISALLSLMNERAAEEDSLQDEAQLFEGLPYEEPEPLLVQTVNDQIDYTDLLISIDNRLSAVEDSIKESNSVQSLDTPLSEYSLNNVLLVGILAVSIIYLGYRFLKDNLLHL